MTICTSVHIWSCLWFATNSTRVRPVAMSHALDSDDAFASRALGALRSSKDVHWKSQICCLSWWKAALAWVYNISSMRMARRLAVSLSLSLSLNEKQTKPAEIQRNPQTQRSGNDMGKSSVTKWDISSKPGLIVRGMQPPRTYPISNESFQSHSEFSLCSINRQISPHLQLCQPKGGAYFCRIFRQSDEATRVLCSIPGKHGCQVSLVEWTHKTGIFGSRDYIVYQNVYLNYVCVLLICLQYSYHYIYIYIFMNILSINLWSILSIFYLYISYIHYLYMICISSI